MKTTKQIADALGIDKQRVYRYIRKQHIKSASHDAGVMYFDDAAETIINNHFLQKSASDKARHDVHQTTSSDAVTNTVISMLQQELKIKNRQIEDLTSALIETSKALHAAQALHAGTMKKQLSETENNKDDSPEEPKEPQGLFSRLFRQKRPV